MTGHPLLSRSALDVGTALLQAANDPHPTATGFSKLECIEASLGLREPPEPSVKELLAAARVIWTTEHASVLTLTDQELLPVVQNNARLRRLAGEHCVGQGFHLEKLSAASENDWEMRVLAAGKELAIKEAIKHPDVEQDSIARLQFKSTLHKMTAKSERAKAKAAEEAKAKAAEEAKAAAAAEKKDEDEAEKKKTADAELNKAKAEAQAAKAALDKKKVEDDAKATVTDSSGRPALSNYTADQMDKCCQPQPHYSAL